MRTSYKFVIDFTRVWKCLEKADHPIAVWEVSEQTGIEDSGYVYRLLMIMHRKGRVHFDVSKSALQKRFSLSSWTPPPMRPPVDLGSWQPTPFDPKLYDVTDPSGRGKYRAIRISGIPVLKPITHTVQEHEQETAQ